MAKFGDSDLLKCSFCGKSQKQVKKLIAGPGVYICDECIDLCNEIIDEELTAQSHLDLDTLPRPKETILAKRMVDGLPEGTVFIDDPLAASRDLQEPASPDWVICTDNLGTVPEAARNAAHLTFESAGYNGSPLWRAVE